MSAFAARFEVVGGRAVGMSIMLEDELVIGRQVEGAGRLADDEEISRLHARVRLDAGGSCTIEDLGSTNGTYVNGAQISGLKTIAEGDTLELGGTALILRELPTGGPARVPKPQTRLTSFAPAGAQAAPSLEPPPPRPVAPPEPTEPPAPAEPPEPPAPPASIASPERTEPPAPAAPLAPPPLALRLEVDFVGREARLALDPSSELVQVVFEAGSWRLNPIPSTQEGGPRERKPPGA